jgi:hypothetical protein
MFTFILAWFCALKANLTAFLCAFTVNTLLWALFLTSRTVFVTIILAIMVTYIYFTTLLVAVSMKYLAKALIAIIWALVTWITI